MMKKLMPVLLFIHLLNYANGQTEWQQTSTSPGGSIWGMTSIGTNIFAGATNGGIYFSPDEGASWIQRNGAFPNMHVFSLAVNGTDLFAGADPGIYKSSDNGITWINITPAGQVSNAQIRALVITGNYIYAGTYGGGPGGVFRSPLNGISSSSWTKFNTGMGELDIRSLKISGTKIYAGTYGQGVWVSPLGTAAWSLTSSTMPALSDYIQTIDIIGNTILAGNISGNPVLYRSTDNGVNWVQSNTSIFNDKPVYSLINDGKYVYAGIEIDAMFISADSGVTWTQYSDGFRKTDGTWHCNHINIRSFLFNGNKMYAGTDCGVWKRDALLIPPPPPPPPVVINNNNKVIFYPNPATDILKLKVPNSFIGAVYSITDPSGRVVQTGKITTTTPGIYIRNLNPGIYIFRIRAEVVQSFKFFKK